VERYASKGLRRFLLLRAWRVVRNRLEQRTFLKTLCKRSSIILRYRQVRAFIRKLRRSALSETTVRIKWKQHWNEGLKSWRVTSTITTEAKKHRTKVKETTALTCYKYKSNQNKAVVTKRPKASYLLSIALTRWVRHISVLRVQRNQSILQRREPPPSQLSTGWNRLKGLLQVTRSRRRRMQRKLLQYLFGGKVLPCGVSSLVVGNKRTFVRWAVQVQEMTRRRRVQAHAVLHYRLEHMRKWLRTLYFAVRRRRQTKVMKEVLIGRSADQQCGAVFRNLMRLAAGRWVGEQHERLSELHSVRRQLLRGYRALQL